jgi:hypothetical protein
VDLKFKAVRTAPVEASDVSRWKDLVRPTNVTEDISPYGGGLSGVTFSIQNDTRVVISNVAVLLVVRSPTGQALDFTLKSFDGVIPPGLAKQVSMTLYVKGYAEPIDLDKYLTERLGSPPQQGQGKSYSMFLNEYNEYDRKRREMAKEAPRYARRGSVELRVLDFKTMTAETPVEQLLKKH